MCVFWNDEEWKAEGKKEDVELAVRIGAEGGRIAIVGLTHVYYA